MTKPRRLHKLKISEVSLVDRPANPFARVELAKRDVTGDAARHPIFSKAVHGAVAEGLNRATAVLAGARSMAKSAQDNAMPEGAARAMTVLKGVPTTVAKSGTGTATGFALTVPIVKLDQERREISGWASVASIDGRPVIDLQGDVVAIDDLREAAHAFVGGPRHGLVMHAGSPAMQVLQSFVLDDDAAAALSITDGRRGWWITARVDDPVAWEAVRAGKLRALSIAGSAVTSGEA